MILESQDKRELSAIRMEKAYRNLKDAKANFNEGRYDTSVNRSYYAALSAVRSILILEGVHPETHKGAITMLSLRFIKKTILPKDILKRFEILLSKRTDVDYGDLDTIDASDAEDSLKSAELIINSIDAVRKKLITELSS